MWGSEDPYEAAVRTLIEEAVEFLKERGHNELATQAQQLWSRTSPPGEAAELVANLLDDSPCADAQVIRRRLLELAER